MLPSELFASNVELTVANSVFLGAVLCYRQSCNDQQEGLAKFDYKKYNFFF
jgi:hypothetical protein